MLQLINVTKDYKTVGQDVHALKGINLRFRRNEFVSILGASGCGKTTLLNIIGGLDHYTTGDLVINGKSTKTYKDHDWDVYRNHRIGFVFQSYNLIPQQTVLGNVEIALTIAGVSKTERKRRAEEALKRVGLEKEMKKRPNQLSGGQMQRVAIARALVNNPEILLADEPTGALDSETSVQIMDLIREIAGERLVIMVTHNPELAEEYSNRIVRLHDGLVVSDSNPYEGEENEKTTERETGKETFETPQTAGAPTKKKRERSSMSFKTSLSLSAKNLIMKKGRTAVTSVAGSIGIISVCLVLALSNGFNRYIEKTQEDMLSSNPLQITETTMDMAAIMSGMNSASEMPDLSQIGDRVYVNSFLTNIAQGMTVQNNLSEEYCSYIKNMDEEYYEAIQFDTGLTLKDNLYTEVLVGEGEGETAVMSLAKLKEHYVAKIAAIDGTYSQLVPLVDYLGSIYGKMPGTNADDVQSGKFGEYVLSQYDIIEGEFPSKENASKEAVLVIGGNNDMTDLTLAQLGFMKESDFVQLFEEDESKKPELKIDFNKIVGKKYRLNDNDYVYTPASEGEYAYTKASGEREQLEEGDGVTVTVTGILRLKDGMNYGCLGNSGLYFTEKLYEEVTAKNAQSKISQTLRKQESVAKDFFAVMQKMAALDNTLPEYKDEYTKAFAEMMEIVSDPENKTLFEKRVEKSFDKAYMGGTAWVKDYPQMAFLSGYYFLSDTSLMREVGAKTNVNSIDIYTSTFEAKENVVNYLDAWNDSHVNDTENQVKYTDTVGMMLSMVEMMLNAITYVLVAFTAISLVVSSVMIGIITYVSVVERVKEIGVLRSLGARKRDIKNLFNAETFIIGLASGVFGVAVTYLLSLGINALLGSLTGITTLASLPFGSAVTMVVISIVLTLISGLIPANAAAKKDPVVALRTE